MDECAKRRKTMPFIEGGSVAHALGKGVAMKKPDIREMKPIDYEAVKALWSSVDGMYLSENDGHQSIQRFLRRNPGLCFVAAEENKIVGAVLCGDDGRWGIIRHLAVKQSHRRQGLASELVERCFSALKESGCRSVVACVLRDNELAMRFFSSKRFEVFGCDVVGRKLA